MINPTTLKSSRIVSVGSFAPPKVWKNRDLAQLMDTSDEWIEQRTGIKQRHWVEGKVTTSDLAFEASTQALKKAGWKADELDLIVFATLSPDHQFPGTGCFLQAKLGIPGVPAIDVRQQCTGFIYAMSVADQYLKTGMYKKVLVVGAEVHSKGLDRTTKGRDVSVLFGDGAGAVCLQSFDLKDAKTESHILSTHLKADGSFAKELWLDAPGMADEHGFMTQEMLDSGAHYPAMNGKTVFMHAVKKMPEILLEALDANELKIEDIDLFLFHQANLRINQMVAKTLGIPESKIFNTIENFGNTTAATIPIGMDEAEKAGKLKKGMLVASAAFGSGFTWASSIYRW